jgi:hypothetical protein
MPGIKSGSSLREARNASSFLESTKKTLLCFDTDPGVFRRPFGVLLGVGLHFNGDLRFVGVRKPEVGTDGAEKTYASGMDSVILSFPVFSSLKRKARALSSVSAVKFDNCFFGTIDPVSAVLS